MRSPEFLPPFTARQHISLTETSSAIVNEPPSEPKGDEYDEERSTSFSTDYIRKRNAGLAHQRKRSTANGSSESYDRRNARLTYQRQRSMSNRSNETEDQRISRLDDQRKRSTANRLSRSVQRKTTRVKYRPQRSETTRSNNKKQRLVGPEQKMNIQHQRRLLETKQQALSDQYKWPSDIPTQLKEYCLQDFCDSTSMSVLRQATCIVCNTRVSASTMKVYTLRNIPNSEKLSCHADLADLISEVSRSKTFDLINVFIKIQCFFPKITSQVQSFLLHQTQSFTKKDIIH